MGWGSFLDKLIDKLPISGRVERWKNEIDTLEQTQRFIEIHKDNARADEYERNDKRLRYLRQLIKNKVSA